MQVVIRGKDDVLNTGRLPDLRSAAQGLRLIDVPGPMRPPAPPASKANLLPVQFPMQFGGPLRPPVPGQAPLASLVRGQSPCSSVRLLATCSYFLQACLLTRLYHITSWCLGGQPYLSGNILRKQSASIPKHIGPPEHTACQGSTCRRSL